MVRVSTLRRTIALFLFAVLSSMSFNSSAFEILPHLAITRDVLLELHATIRGINRTFTDDAIKQVMEANERTDSRWRLNEALFHPEWHFTNEAFSASSNGLWSRRNMILDDHCGLRAARDR